MTPHQLTIIDQQHQAEYFTWSWGHTGWCILIIVLVWVYSTWDDWRRMR